MKRICWYLKRTVTLDLLYKKKDSDEIIGYSDADWAGDVGTENLSQAMFSYLQGQPSHGRAVNKRVWHYRLQKRSM